MIKYSHLRKHLREERIGKVYFGVYYVAFKNVKISVFFPGASSPWREIPGGGASGRQLVSLVRKRREISACIQLLSSFLFSLGPQPRGGAAMFSVFVVVASRLL